MLKKLAGASAVVVAILTVALALWQMRGAVELLLIALAISAGVNPAVQRLSKLGLRREWAISVVFLATVALLGLLVAGAGSQVLHELEAAAVGLPVWYEQLRLSLANEGVWAAGLARELPPSSSLVAWLAATDAAPAMLMEVAGRLTVGTLLLLSAVFLGFYWLLDQVRIERIVLSILPLQARNRVRKTASRIYAEVGLYVRGGVALSLLTAACLLIIYLLLGLPGAALLALFGGLAVIVPVLGPPLALLPPLLVTLISRPVFGLLAVGAAAGVIALVKLYVVPRLFRPGISVNPVLTILCIMALGELGGIWLILLGPPLAAAIQAAGQALRDEHAVSTPLPLQSSAALQALHERLDTIAAAAPPDQPQVDSLVGRARSLVRAADDVLARDVVP